MDRDRDVLFIDLCFKGSTALGLISFGFLTVGRKAFLCYYLSSLPPPGVSEHPAVKSPRHIPIPHRVFGTAVGPCSRSRPAWGRSLKRLFAIPISCVDRGPAEHLYRGSAIASARSWLIPVSPKVGRVPAGFTPPTPTPIAAGCSISTMGSMTQRSGNFSHVSLLLTNPRPCLFRGIFFRAGVCASGLTLTNAAKLV